MKPFKVLLFVILLLFIIGSNYKYEDKIKSLESMIKTEMLINDELQAVINRLRLENALLRGQPDG